MSPQNPAPAPAASTNPFDALDAQYGITGIPAGGGFGAPGFGVIQTPWGGFYLGLDEDKPAQANVRASERAGERVGAVGSKIVKTIDEAYSAFFDFTDAEVEQFRQTLVQAGKVAENAGADVLYREWINLVDLAQQYQAKGKHLSPFDVLATYPGVGGEFTGSKTRTDKTIRRVDPREAEATVKDLVKEMLGRAPTPSELRRLSGAYRNYFASRPQVTKTTTQFSGGDVTGTVSEIVDPGASTAGAMDEIESTIQGTEEFGAYQAATTYMNALLSMSGDEGF